MGYVLTSKRKVTEPLSIGTIGERHWPRGRVRQVGRWQVAGFALILCWYNKARRSRQPSKIEVALAA
jgi:hypothetical protein